MRRDYRLLFGPLAATILFIGVVWLPKMARLRRASLVLALLFRNRFNRVPAAHARQVHEPPSETDSVP